MKIALWSLIFVTFPAIFAKDTILVNRVGPSGSELYVANGDGSGERKLLPVAGFDYDASFSADGKWIVFTSERNRSADIYRVRADGTGLEQLTDNSGFDDARHALSGRQASCVCLDARCWHGQHLDSGHKDPQASQSDRNTGPQGARIQDNFTGPPGRPTANGSCFPPTGI